MELEPPSSSSSPPFSLYLFYDYSYHVGLDVSYSIYKIDWTATYKESLSPILNFPRKDNYASGMRCARLGSKLYFLGGSKREDGELLGWMDYKSEGVWHPRDVYVFDLLTGDFNKMDARLNAGKPQPCVFAANGKLYAIGSIPYYSPDMPHPALSKFKLFECFDPSTNKWQVLDTLPPLDIGEHGFGRTYTGIDWVGCTVLAKHQQVVLVGRLNPFYFKDDSQADVKLVYHLKQNKWTCHGHPFRHTIGALMTLNLQDAGDNDYVYGLTRAIAPPIKFKPVDDEKKRVLINMSIPDPRVFQKSYIYSGYWFTRLLLYVGNGHFCYLSSGMLRLPNSPDCYYLDDFDPKTLGITLTLFKEIKQEKEEKPCFQAQFLDSKSYTIHSSFVNDGELEECFVVNTELLQKRKDKKNKRNKKKVRSFGYTSG